MDETSSQGENVSRDCVPSSSDTHLPPYKHHQEAVDQDARSRPSLYKSVSSPGKMHTITRHQKPPLKRTKSIKDKMAMETAKFFGIAVGDTDPELEDASVDVSGQEEEERKWQQRRFRHLNKQYCIRTETVAEEMQPKIGIDALTDLLGPGGLGTGTAGTPMSILGDVPSPGSVSMARSTDGRRRTTIERRESVAQIAVATLSSILQGSAFRKPRQSRVGELRSGQDFKDITNLPTCTTYTSIRERNALASHNSFPSSKVGATMFQAIAQADKTVRKISGFLSGSGSLGQMNEAEQSESKKEYIGVNGPGSSTIVVKEDQMAIPKPKQRKTSRVEETTFTSGVRVEAGEIQLGGVTLPRTSLKASSRPSYLPLEGTGKWTTSKQARRFVSSTSVANDDVFFDLSPPPPPKQGEKEKAASPKEHCLQEDCSPATLHRIKSRSWDEGLSSMPSDDLRQEGRAQAAGGASFLGFPLLTRQNGYDLDDGDQPCSSAYPAAATQYSLLQHRAFVNEQQQRRARPVFHQQGHKPAAGLFFSLLRWITGRDAEGKASIKSLIKFHFSTRGVGSTLRRPVDGQPGQKRKRSLPIFGKFKRNKKLDPEVVRQLKDESCDYRPFFTYWITTVQVVVMLFTLYSYGIGTDFSNGLGVIERSGDVMASYLSIRRIVVWESNNVWIGPRFADLVHAGAKYSPCMRRDPKIHDQIMRERKEEADSTGCCVGSGGCFQTSECPKQFATLIKWTGNNSLAFPSIDSSRRKPSRVVCGQDPRYCRNPNSVHPFEWGKADISEWPVCQEMVPSFLIPKQAKHMHCEITGRPCCIQMHGQCRITTKNYCNFVRGYYHPNATLCSQVSCLNDVCGMTSFLSSDRPDQVYRLVTPLFIHAGILRCLFTVVGQMTIMRNFETMIGWHRLSIIYFISGVGGYLASAIFVPYMPEVGPAGSQGGVLGALIVNVLYNWHFIRRPRKVLLIHLSIAASLFLTGFLPYIDNWAQLIGFVIGCLLAAALIPYFNFGKRTRHRRIIIVTGALSITLVIFVILFTIFYAHPIIDNPVFSWLNCPFTNSKVCDHQSLILKNWLPI